MSFGVNVFGPIYLTQAVVQIGKMPRGGRIINIGSIVSKMGMAFAAVYAAAKAASDSLTAAWAGEVSTSTSPGLLLVPFALSKRCSCSQCLVARLQARDHGECTCTWTSSNRHGRANPRSA